MLNMPMASAGISDFKIFRPNQLGLDFPFQMEDVPFVVEGSVAA
jgi:hypothetical protein